MASTALFKNLKHCLPSLEQFSVRFSIKLQMYLVGYPKIYGLWLWVSEGCCVHIWLPKSKNYVMMCHNIIHRLTYHKTPPIPIMLEVINANSLSCCSLLGV